MGDLIIISNLFVLNVFYIFLLNQFHNCLDINSIGFKSACYFLKVNFFKMFVLEV